jgi:hypothetical protein
MTILDELLWRGLLADCTDLDALTKRLSGRHLYAGFVPPRIRSTSAISSALRAAAPATATTRPAAPPE